MKIRNKQTGEIREIDPSQASKYGLSVQQPSQQGTGLANVPVIGGLLRGAAAIAPAAGNVIGQIAGTAAPVIAGGGPEDPVGDIAGITVGRTAGGAAGQAAGETAQKFINNILLGDKSTETAGQNVADVLKAGGTGALYSLLPGGGLASRALGGAAVGAGQQVFSDVTGGQDPTKDIGGIGVNAAVTGALNALVPGGSKVIDRLGSSNQIIHPIGRLAEAVKSTPEMTKNVPLSTLESKFGTFDNPNMDLVKGTVPGTKIQEARQLLKNEILAQGRGSKSLGTTTYGDLLDLKQGAYKAYEPMMPNWQKGMYKNIGRTYKDIIHSDVPNAKQLDNIMTAIYRIEKNLPRALKLAGYGGGGLGAYELLKNLTRSTGQ